MERLTHTELIGLLSALGVMLMLSRMMAEMGRKFRLPVVMGEILVGIMLGPSLLGEVAPGIFEALFPTSGAASIALQGITSISVVMLLFVAGMEVQLPLVLQQGKVAVSTSVMSMVVPFATGFLVAWKFPELFYASGQENKWLFPLFFGTALAISALPVIARILMDMNLFKTRIGMLIIASAMFNDLLGWLIFSMVLGMMDNGPGNTNVLSTALYIVGFGLFMLTIGKRIIDRSLPWVQTRLSWPGGVLSIALGICFLSAAFTEFIGVHAILGAFIVGIALGDSVHLHERAREIIHQFVTNIFAPLFFVSIGLRVNFVQNFDMPVVITVLVLAFAGKMIGAGLGARLGGLGWKESMAVGSGMNARGAMEIILGTLALQAGIIDEVLFVALVIMAMVTSLTSGPMMRKFLS